MSQNDFITRPTKISRQKFGTFLEKKDFINRSFQKISFIKVDLLVKYSSEKKNQKDSIGFWCWKVTLKVQFLQILRMLFNLFIILVGLTMTWFSEKMLIFNTCRHSLMPNLIKKSWTVSNWQVSHLWIVQLALIVWASQYLGHIILWSEASSWKVLGSLQYSLQTVKWLLLLG